MSFTIQPCTHNEEVWQRAKFYATQQATFHVLLWLFLFMSTVEFDVLIQLVLSLSVLSARCVTQQVSRDGTNDQA
jgi:hypothetical protein